MWMLGYLAPEFGKELTELYLKVGRQRRRRP
jgi:hypothetical protein